MFDKPLTTQTQGDDKYVIPPENDPKLGKWSYNKFEIAKKDKDKKNFHRRWLQNYRLKRGEHFRIKNSRFPLIPVNIFHVAVSRTKANLTDNKPRFEVAANDETQESYASMYNAASEQWWKRTNQQLELSMTVDNQETFGTTVEKMIFNPELEGGIGDAETNIVDPFKFFPWPGITKIQKMPHLFEIDILELATIRKMFPEKGHLVKADQEHSDKLTGKERENVMGGTSLASGQYSHLPNNYVDTGEGKPPISIDRAMVIMHWMKDFTMVPVYEDRPIPLRDEEGDVLDDLGQPVMAHDDFGNPLIEQVQVGEELKYPGGIRVVFTANSGKIVLSDNANPSINPNMPKEQAVRTYLWDRYPYQKSDAMTDNSNFFGPSIIEQIEVMGRELNKKVSQIAAHIDRQVKPTLIMPQTAGIPEHRISNQAGQQWFPTNQIASQFIRYLDVPSLPSDYYNYLEMLMKLVEMITGLNDVTEGRKPKGIAAASAIVALQEKAETTSPELVHRRTQD
jgi:hypothetical protein